jgi:hypothetical protein
MYDDFAPIFYFLQFLIDDIKTTFLVPSLSKNIVLTSSIKNQTFRSLLAIFGSAPFLIVD